MRIFHIHTYAALTYLRLFGALRRAPVFLTYTLLLFSIVDTDSSTSASPRVGVASGLAKHIPSHRLGRFREDREEAPKLTTEAETLNKTLLARPPWRT